MFICQYSPASGLRIPSDYLDGHKLLLLSMQFMSLICGMPNRSVYMPCLCLPLSLIFATTVRDDGYNLLWTSVETAVAFSGRINFAGIRSKTTWNGGCYCEVVLVETVTMVLGHLLIFWTSQNAYCNLHSVLHTESKSTSKKEMGGPCWGTILFPFPPPPRRP